MVTEVLSCQFFPDNGTIIKQCARLGYLKKSMRILDPTYGNGLWWTEVKFPKLVAHDLAIDGLDFRSLPHKSRSFDAITYDPPYVSVGGRESSNIKEMYDAYGLLGAPTSPAKLQTLINDGLTEMVRLLRPSGYLLVKCQNYVSSGKLFLGVNNTLNHGLMLGLTVQDQFIHARKSGGPQPKNRTKTLPSGEKVKSKQQHSRNNWSTMIVFQKPKGSK